MGLRTLLRRRRDRSLGQSLVEFALILPVFLVILSVALDLGRMAYARVTIANVAREASFQAAKTPTSYQAGQPCSTATNMVICRAVLESKGSVVTVNPSDITMTCTPDCAGTMGNTVTVKATGTFNLLTPVMAAFFGGTTITFSSSATNQVSALPTAAAAAATLPPTAAPTTTPVPTETPVPTATPLVCDQPSAGFTYVTSPLNDTDSPVTVVVTDTSTASAGCEIDLRVWTWGDGTTSANPASPVTHTYYWYGPAANKNFSLTLTVSHLGLESTSGAQIVPVKK